MAIVFERQDLFFMALIQIFLIVAPEGWRQDNGLLILMREESAK